MVSDKKILLFRRMLQDIHYDDMAVADLLITGVKLFGELDRVGIWRADVTKGALVTPQMMWHGAKAAQKKVLTCAPGWTSEDEELWKATVEEVEGKGLKGPLSEEEVVEMAGRLWIAARRFAIIQNGRLRPIDDFSEFLVNACFGAKEKVGLHRLDQIVGWARAWLEAVDDDRVVSLCDIAGRSTEARSMMTGSWPRGEALLAASLT